MRGRKRPRHLQHRRERTRATGKTQDVNELTYGGLICGVLAVGLYVAAGFGLKRAMSLDLARSGP